MSHITTVETKIQDISLLQKALTALGHEFEVAQETQKLQVRAWDKNVIEADMEIKLEGPYGIAVTQTEEGVELSADWWAVETYTERKQEDIMAEINKQYAYETVMDKISSDGYSVVMEEEDNKESLHIVVRRWV
jgi:hypothetical protein